jgi:hypothetical protein
MPDTIQSFIPASQSGLIQFIKPHIRLLMVQGVTPIYAEALEGRPVHKGLFPKRSLRGTLKINDLHYRKPKAPIPGTHNAFYIGRGRGAIEFVCIELISLL